MDEYNIFGMSRWGRFVNSLARAVYVRSYTITANSRCDIDFVASGRSANTLVAYSAGAYIAR